MGCFTGGLSDDTVLFRFANRPLIYLRSYGEVGTCPMGKVVAPINRCSMCSRRQRVERKPSRAMPGSIEVGII